MFYEVYLLDYNGDLIDVPVRFKNPDGTYKDGLYRRYFLLDTLSGLRLDGTYESGGTPEVVRYASDFKLRVQLDPKFPERILVPVIDITYKAEKTEDIEQSASVPGTRYPRIKYTTDQTMETDGFWSFAGTVFWIVLVITVLSVILDVYVATRAETLTSGSNQAAAA